MTTPRDDYLKRQFTLWSLELILIKHDASLYKKEEINTQRVKTIRRHKENTAIFQSRRETSTLPTTWSSSIYVLDLWRNKFPLLAYLLHDMLLQYLQKLIHQTAPPKNSDKCWTLVRVTLFTKEQISFQEENGLSGCEAVTGAHQ